MDPLELNYVFRSLISIDTDLNGLIKWYIQSLMVIISLKV